MPGLMRRVRPLLALLLVLAAAMPASADTGDLDPRFDGDGIAWAFANGASGTTVGVDSRGRTVVAGYTLDGEADVAVARFKPDGTPDPSFGAGGRVRIDLGGQDYAFDLALADDDAIVVAGRRSTVANELAFVLWLDPGGAPLTAFGGTGWVTVTYGKAIQAATAVALTPGGRVVIGGYTSNGITSRTAFARLSSTGALDPGFDADGRFVVNLVPGPEQVEDLVIQDNGRIVAAGTADKGLLPRASVVRVLASGGLDTSFGKNGLAVIDFGPGADVAYAIAQRGDGSFAVAGAADDGGRGSWGVARLKPSGTLDGTFGTFGVVVLRFSPTAVEQAYAVMVTGTKLVVAGRIHTKAGDDDLGVVRLRAAGGLDPTFGGGDGKVTIDVNGGRDWATGLAHMADGRIVVGGTGTRDGTFRLLAARLRV